jgi:imidazole glycerol-phosphate synthase subunit HisF
MLRPRITPCLLVQDGGLVKTRQFKDPTYVGDPINAVKIFNEKETDELIVLDIDATVKRVEPNFRLISQFAVECRMPLCYGGGIRKVEQAKRIIELGVEKVSISAAALETPELIAEMAGEIGSQSVVVVIDARRTGRGLYEVMTHNGTRKTGRTPIEVARLAEESGAGEILVNSIDNDGMMQGYDLALAVAVREATRLPMTVLGGAGSYADMSKLIAACGVLGVAAGSFFVFKGRLRGVLISYPGPQQKEEVIRAALPAISGLSHQA